MPTTYQLLRFDAWQATRYCANGLWHLLYNFIFYLASMLNLKNSLNNLTGGWLMLWEVVKVVAMALIIVILVKHFLFQPFFVQGASMEPTYQDREYLIIDELSYRFHEPQRGDVVVFRYPNDPSQYFIKRVIGLPGDTVEVREGSVWVNGKRLDESSYLDVSVETIGTTDLTIPAGYYFLMGDNHYSYVSNNFVIPPYNQQHLCFLKNRRHLKNHLFLKRVKPPCLFVA